MKKFRKAMTQTVFRRRSAGHPLVPKIDSNRT